MSSCQNPPLQQRQDATDNDRSNGGIPVAELAAEAARACKRSKVHAVGPSLFHRTYPVSKRDGGFVPETCVLNKNTSRQYPYSVLPSVESLLEATYQGPTLVVDHVGSLGLQCNGTLCTTWGRRRLHCNQGGTVVEDRPAPSTETAASTVMFSGGLVGLVAFVRGPRKPHYINTISNVETVVFKV